MRFFPRTTPPSPLWGNADFLKFWAGQSISEIGSRITREALPLAAVLTLGASPMTIGWLSVASSVPVLVLGLVVGAWLDRIPRRPFLLLTDVLRCVLLLAVPVMAWLGHLAMWLLFILSALLSMLTLSFTIASESYIPTLVGRPHLVDGNAKLSMTQSFAEIVGPGLAGVLVQTLTAPVALLLDALSYLVSAFSITLIRRRETHIARERSRSSLRRDIAEGVRAVLGQRTLLALAALAGTSSLFAGIIFTMDVLYAIRTLHLTAAVFGFTVMFGGVGALFGAAFCQPLVRRFGFGRVLIASALLNGGFAWLIPLAHGSLWTAAAFLIGWQIFGDFSGVIVEVLAASLRQSLAPEHILARVNSVVNLLTAVLGTLGSLGGAWLASEFSLRVAMAVGAGGMTLAAFWLFAARIASIRTLTASAE